MHAGKWAAEVQAQAREEQTLQSLGRSRPVYRDGEAPVVMLLGQVVPRGVTVDAVVALKDLAPAGALWRHARARGGVLSWEQGCDVPSRMLVSGGIGKPLPEGLADMTDRRSQGLVRYAYERMDGTAHEVDVLASEAHDVHELLRRFEASERRPGWDRVDSVREVMRGAPLATDPHGVPLAPRAHDKRMVDLLGTPEQQAAAEVFALSRARRMDDVMLKRDGTPASKLNAPAVPLRVESKAALYALSIRPEGIANLQPHLVEAAEPEATPATVGWLESLDVVDLFAAWGVSRR